jgi:glycosyltransferase involved in cell wall biosynthesis
VKILLVANYLPDHQQSMLRFCDMLDSELQQAGHATRVIRPKARLGGQGERSKTLKWLAYIDKFALFVPRLKKAAAWADVVHICDHAYSLYTRHVRQFSTVVTCHDLIAARRARGEFPEFGAGWTGRRYQHMIVDSLKRACRVACDSEATRSDVLRLCNLSLVSTSVVPVALNFAYRPVYDVEKALYLRSLGIAFCDGFVLHVGASSWYKNQSGVLRIFQQLVTHSATRHLGLVMVSDRVTVVLRNLIAECGLESRVRIISNVPSEGLRALYSAATVLLFPSLCEGFGWPIIEAQACGCPVFTSNRAPMTEVGGDAAVYFDPEDPTAAADIIAKSMPHLRSMSKAGLVNARRFSPDRMIAGYLRLYQEARKSAGENVPSSATLGAAEPSMGEHSQLRRQL